ncbi:MAG TPA: GNAT family N-acetyltransferase [Marmoricola sp.]|nr:GNAT family N-acetyltransferase [Marmoricola sp.]
MSSDDAALAQDPPYPAHWVADVLLRDGRTAHLRPVSPDDVAALTEFYDQVSAQSKYYRFFAPMPNLSSKELQRITHVDHHDRVGFVLTVAEKIIAIGQYEGIGDHRAEVAFLVQDAHQGRGIGQLLLEHLAQAGRENGITKFEAQVLPDNKKMVQVFKEMGYRIASGWEEGSLNFHFDIKATDTAIGVMVAREHDFEAASIGAFLNARSVAIIGASRRADTVGSQLVRNLVLADYAGKLYVVNPSAESVAGMPAYASVNDIPGEVEVAVVAVPAEVVKDVVIDCAAKGVLGLIVISSGFAETGDEGRRRQRHLVGLARSYGLRLIGPNALGVINTSPEVSLNASLAPVMPPRGRAGFFCQSGALGTAILEKVRNRGLGLSTFVSAGNRADVSGNDLLQYWEEDDATEVVLLYLESIGNPRKFSRIARRVSVRKPIVAVRSGRATQGVPMGHAVRQIAAPPAAVDAMFRQAGIIQVDSLDAMFDVAQLLAHQPLPRGSRVAIVGNSDALGLLAVDAAAAHGLPVTSVKSLGPTADADDFEEALDAAIDHPEVDAVIAVYVPPLDSPGADVAQVLAAVGEQSDKPLVSSFLGREGVPELLRVPDHTGLTAGRGSVPSYPGVEAAVAALAKVMGYVDWLSRGDAGPEPIEGCDEAAAAEFVDRLLAESPKGLELDIEQMQELLSCYGIDLWRPISVASLDEALAAGETLGWDVVLKATAEQYRHRPDLAHVWRGITSVDDMTQAWNALDETLSDPANAGFVVQRNAGPGVPLTVSGLEDPLFGPALSFGVAGPLTELAGDRVYAIPPLSTLDAVETVRAIKAAPLLFEYRGTAPVDVEAVEALLRRVAQLKEDLPQVKQIDIDLAQAGAAETSVLTAAIRIEPVADPRSDLFVRRLTAPLSDTIPG